MLLLLQLVLVLLLAAAHQLTEDVGLVEGICLSCRRLLRGATCLALCLLTLILGSLVLVHVVRLVLLSVQLILITLVLLGLLLPLVELVRLSLLVLLVAE